MNAATATQNPDHFHGKPGSIALAAGISLVSWVPLPALPWMSWGKWLFVLATPVQFIGG